MTMSRALDGMGRATACRSNRSRVSRRGSWSWTSRAACSSPACSRQAAPPKPACGAVTHVDSVDALRSALASGDRPALLLVHRNGATIFLTLERGAK